MVQGVSTICERVQKILFWDTWISALLVPQSQLWGQRGTFPTLQEIWMSLPSFTTVRIVSLPVSPAPTSLPFAGISGTDDTKMSPAHCQWHAGNVGKNMHCGPSTIMWPDIHGESEPGALPSRRVFLCTGTDRHHPCEKKQHCALS